MGIMMSDIKKEFYGDMEDTLTQALSGLSAAEQMIFARKAQSMARKNIADTAKDKESAITWVIANTAYQYILDYNVTAKQALTYSAQDHEAELEEVLAEKSRYSGRLSGTIVKSNDDHPIQVDMKKQGKMNRQALKSTDTVWQMLNLLKDFREAYEDFLKLEKALEDIKKLDGRVIVLEDELKDLQELLGVKSMTDKDKAGLMKSKGFTQKEVGNALGKSLPTIKRWWKDI